MGKTRSGLFGAALVLAVVAGACAPDDGADTGTTTDTLTTPPATSAAAPTDAQIAMIVVTANSADSAAGEVAKTKGTDAEVKAYGERMVTDHGAVNKQATDLATRLNLTPEASDASRSMQSDAQSHMSMLQNASGTEFDKAYIDHEVTMHQQVLDALDQQLIPNAQNAELKSLLETVRPAIAAHLESAKQIQTKLGQAQPAQQ